MGGGVGVVVPLAVHLDVVFGLWCFSVSYKVGVVAGWWNCPAVVDPVTYESCRSGRLHSFGVCAGGGECCRRSVRCFIVPYKFAVVAGWKFCPAVVGPVPYGSCRGGRLRSFGVCRGIGEGCRRSFRCFTVAYKVGVVAGWCCCPAVVDAVPYGSCFGGRSHSFGVRLGGGTGVVSCSVARSGAQAQGRSRWSKWRNLVLSDEWPWANQTPPLNPPHYNLASILPTGQPHGRSDNVYKSKQQRRRQRVRFAPMLQFSCPRDYHVDEMTNFLFISFSVFLSVSLFISFFISLSRPLVWE
jgi:hypothetical protein